MEGSDGGCQPSSKGGCVSPAVLTAVNRRLNFNEVTSLNLACMRPQVAYLR